VDLRTKLQETWDLAHDELRRSQVRQKHYFDSRAKDRTFKSGDQVLVLLPTSENKLLMHWKGPFEVLQRKDGPDYLIDMNGKQNIFHANLLKRYISAASSESSSGDSSDESSSQVTFGSATLEVTFAAILEFEEELSEHGPELETLNPLRTETVEDVKISQNLSAEQQSDIRALLDEYQDIFTDVPSITPLEEHRILLTNFRSKQRKGVLTSPCHERNPGHWTKKLTTCCPWE